jgi:hypothetical protein
MRRWGPIAAIVVVLAIVGGLIAMSGGDDEDDPTDTTESASPGTGGDEGDSDLPEGVMTYNQAKDDGTEGDFEWLESCDRETGLLAIPYAFRQECFASVDDNGGDTYAGVTADAIKVVVYIAPENDPVLDFITGPINNDDTNAQVQDTVQGYVDMFNATFQTYGRTVEIEFLQGSGISSDEVAARADAVKAMTEMGAFAVWGGPILAPGFTEEVMARGGVCIGCPAVTDAEPSAWTFTPNAAQIRTHFFEYASKRLKGKPAEFAGDESMHDKDRVYGHVYIDTGSEDSRQAAKDFKNGMADEGMELAEQIGYELNPGTLAEQASTAIARLQAANVTTVLISGDPIAPKTFTEVATQQGFFPEWVLTGSPLLDTTAFGRTYDQEQWKHAFGISSLEPRMDDSLLDAILLYDWWAGEYPPADDSANVIFPNPLMFFLGIQAAGPDLNVDTFKAGMAFNEPQEPRLTQYSVSYGDHGLFEGFDMTGIDDMTEIWWDPTLEGDDEIRKAGVGMYRNVDGGKRYLPGEWGEDDKLFDADNGTSLYKTLPAGEEPPDVEPFPGSPAAG